MERIRRKNCAPISWLSRSSPAHAVAARANGQTGSHQQTGSTQLGPGRSEVQIHLAQWVEHITPQQSGHSMQSMASHAAACATYSRVTPCAQVCKTVPRASFHQKGWPRMLPLRH